MLEKIIGLFLIIIVFTVIYSLFSESYIEKMTKNTFNSTKVSLNGYKENENEYFVIDVYDVPEILADVKLKGKSGYFATDLVN